MSSLTESVDVSVSLLSEVRQRTDVLARAQWVGILGTLQLRLTPRTLTCAMLGSCKRV